jgi:hydrocephalus-inducing protein
MFEPSALGSSRATLTVSSVKAGTYSCVLIGQAAEPSPQGPIIIKASNLNSSIVLKNIFNQAVSYLFSVDNAAFVVKASENIPAKKTYQLNIQYKPAAGLPQDQPISGKLTISCPSVNSSSWTYYLRGVS